MRMEIKERDILKEINLEIREGKIYGFVGPSREGKATFVLGWKYEIKVQSLY